MPDYDHTQPGTVLRAVLGSLAVVAAVVAVPIGVMVPAYVAIPLWAAFVLAISTMLFHSLRVTVSPDVVMLRFGVGLIRKRFAIADIISAAIVRNRWWYGWGIRITPHGWLYNVSGLDAVEIHLRNGRKRRIGTDEPSELLAAIESVLGDSSQ